MNKTKKFPNWALLVLNTFSIFVHFDISNVWPCTIKACCVYISVMIVQKVFIVQMRIWVCFKDTAASQIYNAFFNTLWRAFPPSRTQKAADRRVCILLSFAVCSVMYHSPSLSWRVCFSFPREILAEIKRLRAEHDAACQASPEKGSTNPTLLAELRLLR